ncbi:hypothetical protein NCS52_00917500 [Fusarium sp. LHS14.1]|nr:hypothetical protein NCS52_00917500 [Fusarium sp. LHS14.1]
MPPFITTPRSVPVEGRMVQPGEMRAIRVRTSCTVDVRLEDGSMQKKTLQTGVFGYLVQRQGSKCLVQLLNHTGQRALCQVPYDTLDVGQLHSQLRVIHPSLQAAQAAAAIAHRRATDPAGRALIMIWNSIQKNKDILKEVGLRVDVCENILEDEAEKQKCLNVLLASFSNDVWRVLNTGLPLEPFLNLPKVTPTFPRLKANQLLIYLRLYTQPGTTRFAKYGGRTIREFPFMRQTEHDAATADITCVSPHYCEARKYSARDRHAIPMMILTDSRKSVMAMAEMTLCCLLRTWSPIATNFSPDSVTEALTSGSMSHRLLASTFSKIVDNALEKTQYPLFRGVGCNWNCPL